MPHVRCVQHAPPFWILKCSQARCKVDPTGFQNDMSVINSKNDVFTALIHLGYLSYNWRKNECYIPNREVGGEMVNKDA